MTADPRFYEALGPLTVAALLGGAALQRGDPQAQITGVAPLDRAGASDVAFAGPGADAAGCAAGLLFVATVGQAEASRAAACALAPEPRAAFGLAAARLFRPRAFGPQDTPVHPSARIEEGALVSPFARVAAGVQIGRGAVIAPGVVLGPGVAIGRDTRMGPNAVVQCALIGDGVTIGPNAVIGDAGFGVAPGPAGLIDLPHLGRVIIQDRVSIGAGTTVDRGLLDDTSIGEGAKIDNLCQIAHNVRVGRFAVIASFAGLSGSCEIGDGARLAGRVGVADHVRIGARAQVAAGSGLMHDIPPGETWGGYPAKPIRRWMREVAWLRKMTGKTDGG